ncbi:MAG: hypothetical protein AAF393_08940 [Pseudomonadota bacterium]
MQSLFILPFLTTPALACTSGTTLFSCAIAGKAQVVTVCNTGDAVTYTYGRPDRAPDISLASAVATVGYSPWNGIGRSIYEDVTFTNAGYDYTVWGALDRQILEDDPADQMSGGIVVTKGDETVAQLMCDPKTIAVALDQLWGLKEAAGQCYDRDAFEWRAC